MAAKKRRKKRKSRRGWKWLALFALLALALTYGYGYICAHIVRIEYRNVYIDGLKPGQDGVKILFVSDFKIKDMSGARDAAALVKRLYELEPDIVILGGDYTTYSLTDRLTMEARDTGHEAQARLRQARQAFFSALKPYNTTGRLFVIEGDDDARIAGLAEDCALGNAILLRDGIGYVTVRGEPLTIVGAKDYGGAGSYAFKNVTRAETVIAVTHNPDAYAALATVTDASGRAVADLILAGHTLGGQIKPFGISAALLPGGYGGEFVAGHYKHIGVNMLVSRGIGTEWLPIRIGAQAEAFLITLKAG